MREYEMIYVLKPDSSEEIVERINSRIDRVLEEYAGILLSREVWGKKKLAYEIDKNAKGQFFQLNYLGEGALNAELIRVMRLDDSVLRFMPVKVAENVDVEARKAAVKERVPMMDREEPADDDMD